MKMFLVVQLRVPYQTWNLEGVSSRTFSLKGYTWNGIEEEALLGLGEVPRPLGCSA